MVGVSGSMAGFVVEPVPVAGGVGLFSAFFSLSLQAPSASTAKSGKTILTSCTSLLPLLLFGSL